MTQLALTGTPTPPHLKLTGRQRGALEQIAEHQPLSSERLGAWIHERRLEAGGKGHSAANPCRFCNEEGAAMGRNLRGKQLVRYSLSYHGWVIPGYKPAGKPVGGIPDDF